jgi:uncharacterized protein YndB with AHSA1/START domain
LQNKTEIKGANMATSVITPDKDTVVVDIFVAAPAERVFQAISDPKQLLQWWGQKGLYRGNNWEADVRPGGKWRCEGVSEKGDAYTVHGEYLEVDPPRKLVHTWIASWSGPGVTTVHWELAPTGNGTKVNVRHTGFKAMPDAARDHAQGWSRVLVWMQAFAERGDTIDSRPAITSG